MYSLTMTCTFRWWLEASCSQLYNHLDLTVQFAFALFIPWLMTSYNPQLSAAVVVVDGIDKDVAVIAIESQWTYFVHQDVTK